MFNFYVYNLLLPCAIVIELSCVRAYATDRVLLRMICYYLIRHNAQVSIRFLFYVIIIQLSCMRAYASDCVL